MEAAKLIAEARRHLAEGSLKTAQGLYQRVLDAWPNDVVALRELGLIRHKAGQPREALKLIESALRSSPNNPEALNTCGLVLFALNRHQEALERFEHGLSVAPNDPELLINYGLALGALGRHDDALGCFQGALRKNPDELRALKYEGIALANLKRHDEAIDRLERAAAIVPEDMEVFENLGKLFAARDRHEEAIASFDRALTDKSDSHDLLTAKGRSLLKAGRFSEAVETFDGALAQKLSRSALEGRARALIAIDRANEALESLDRWLLENSDDVLILTRRGQALRKLNRDHDAAQTFELATLLHPANSHVHFCLSETLLRLGDYERGWREYEWRWQWEGFTSSRRQITKPKWLGQVSPSGKRIYVWTEQGFGDTIQFARYGLLLAEQGAKVLMGVSRQLAPLLREIDERVALTTKHPTNEFDLHCPFMSLPLAFRTTLETIPWSKPYLKTPAEHLSHWSKRLGPHKKPRIGLVWSGRITHANDHRRSIALKTLRPLLLPGLDFFSLQPEVRPGDQAALEDSVVIRHFGTDLKDFADTAALISLLDLVITVDTSVAHLAGALGKPVWIMLPFSPDWRWLLDREDSPWYPSARLFRQSSMGDWDSVIRRITDEVRKHFTLNREVMADTSVTTPRP